MNKQQTIRVGVFASSSLNEVKLVVMDMLVMLNRMFAPRGVEFELADSADDATGEDLAVVLYWRDFGDLPLPKFETAYESLKSGGNPAKIYVFFRESPDELDEAMQAFKDSFATKYGHFYCHFEHVDSVRFQLATQCLAYLPNRVEDLIKLDDGGKISLLGQHIADMENLPFAKLNSKCKSLKRQIAAAEAEVANLEEESAADPDDDDLKDSLREARVRRHDLKEELKQYNGFLFSTALFFAKESAKEMDERVRQAKELFEQGKVQAANRVLDLSELCESADRNLLMFEVQREACEKDIQALLTKAEMVLVDDQMTMVTRVDVACKAYENGIAVARKIHWEDGKQAEAIFDYARLLQEQNRFQVSVKLYDNALEIYRRLASLNPEVYEPDVAMTLNNLANLHRDTRRLEDAELEYGEALKIYHRLAVLNPEVYESNVAIILNNLAILHRRMQRFLKAESEYGEALEIRRRLSSCNPEAYELDVAMTLNNLANLHCVKQNFSEAENEYGEALDIRRRYASMTPEAFEPEVAMTLNNLANLHSFTQRISDAESEYGEALEIRRRFATENPEKYEPDVASTLNNLSVLHKKMQRYLEAEKECGEALEIHRRLALVNPDAYEPDVAGDLNNLAILHGDTQRFSEAELEYGEALEIYRRLASENPEAYDPDVAMTLNNLAVLHNNMKRFADSEREYTEALAVSRRLMSASPEAYEPDVAMTLSNMADLHRDMQKLEEAEQEYTEALEIRRRLMSDNLEAHELDVVDTLMGLSGLYDGLVDREKDAVALATEALKLCRECDARIPGSCSDKLNTICKLLEKHGNKEGIM